MNRDPLPPQRDPAELADEEKDRLAEEAAPRNPDPVTRREALELELMDEERSEAGEEIGDEVD